MRRSVAPLLATTALLLATACGGSIPHATDAQLVRVQQRWPDTTRASLDRGRSVYVTRCSGCHTLYEPGARPPSKWPGIVEKMAPRAKLSPPDRELVLRYLAAVAER